MIFVVGGNGFVGQHVARHLLDHGEEVAVTTCSRAAPPVLLADAVAAGRARLVPLDVTDGSAVAEAMSALRPRVVIDVSGHAPKVLAPAADVMFRTAALTTVLEAARGANVGRVVLMSSMDVYWSLRTIISSSPG